MTTLRQAQPEQIRKKSWSGRVKNFQKRKLSFLLHSGCVFIDFLKDHFESKLSKYWSKINDIAKRSYNKPNKESENGQPKSVVCYISKFDLNINWIECAKCLNWVNCLYEGNFSQGTSLSDDAHFQSFAVFFSRIYKKNYVQVSLYCRLLNPEK